MKSQAPKPESAFTLVEMVVAMAIFAIMAVLIFTILNNTASITSKTSSRLDANRVGRECLDLIGKDLKNAAIPYYPTNSTSLQLLVNPVTSTGTANVDAKFRYPHSMFWQTPVSRSNTYGNFAVVGYYLIRDLQPATPRLNRLQLRRLYVEPQDPTTPSSTAEYKIYTDPTDWYPKALLEKFAPDDVATDNTNGQKGWVADGVLAMWIRCLDPLGRPITHTGASSGLDTSNDFTTYSFDSRLGYCYTDQVGDIAYPIAKILGGGQPSVLPSFIEVALVCTSPADARRITSLPTISATNPVNFYAEVDAYTTAVRAANPQVKSFESFSRKFRIYAVP